MSMQAYLDNIEDKTGVTPERFITMAKEKGFDDKTKAGEILKWLKDDYELGRGHGMAIVYIIKHGDKAPDNFVGKAGTHGDPSPILRLTGKEQ